MRYDTSNTFCFCSEKISDHLEKKKLWIDNEIEKIVIRQKQIDLLEKELHERDESLRKKEALISERDKLQVKKVKSSQTLSKVIQQKSLSEVTLFKLFVKPKHHACVHCFIYL